MELFGIQNTAGKIYVKYPIITAAAA